MTGRKLHLHHEPLTHEVLQVLQRDHQWDLARLRHSSEGKEKQRPVSSTNALHYF
jgi:hypothetical protein